MAERFGIADVKWRATTAVTWEDIGATQVEK
jgi:hypothetical protein